MITLWANQESLTHFAGEEWSNAIILSAMRNISRFSRLSISLLRRYHLASFKLLYATQFEVFLIALLMSNFQKVKPYRRKPLIYVFCPQE
jgi:hypothetical protein